MGCPCAVASTAQEPDIGHFTVVRNSCPVLRDLLIPEQDWREFLDWHAKPYDIACHRSILLLAFQRGSLDTITGPIHRRLCADGGLRSELTNQYRNDLRERWFLADDELERHKRSRLFSSRVAEIQFADWLNNNGWQTYGLEALGGQVDIEATSNDYRHPTAFEIKYIGEGDEDFGLTLDALSDKPAVQALSPTDPLNYLIFRVYEAAFQLRRTTQRRVAAIIIDDGAWHRFIAQMRNNWIDWDNPSLYEGHDWPSVWPELATKYPGFPGDLRSTLGNLNELWIARRTNGHAFVIQQQNKFPLTE